ncbi:MAG: branched-chain amino acid ABC transporter permease [Burkholderiaceae bacterium]
MSNTSASIARTDPVTGPEVKIVSPPSFLGNGLRQKFVNALILLLLLALPLAAHLQGADFWVDFATRLVILAIAAVTLNLILGFGGMVSFGHAAFIGIGAYAVGIPAYYDYFGGWLHFPLAMLAGALFALVTGAISLRTRGVHFIMITMAFAQMMFYAIVSIEEYGGDDGLVIYGRSELPFFSIEESLNLFLLSYGSLLVILYLCFRIVNSRFGFVLQGAKGNEARMSAVGYNVYWYRLAAYVIAGALCGYAGALLGNFTSFISPEMTDWTRSGELIFMVILGGAASLFGPVLGAAAFLVLEEVLQIAMNATRQGWGIYWHLPFGLLLIFAVLFLKRGLIGLFHGKERQDG